MKLATIFSLAFAACFLCSCSSIMKKVDHQTSVSGDKALVTMYYRASVLNTGPIEVFADDISHGEVYRKSSVQFELAPGKHTIYARLGRNWGVLDATVDAGKRYFAYLVAIPDFFTGAKVSIDPVSASEGPGEKGGLMAKEITYALDPLKMDGWQAKRKGAIKRIEARHKAGNTKPTTLNAGDGI